MSSLVALDLEALRAQLPATPGARPLWTGEAALDALLGAEGVPVGRITEWVGAASSGKTGVLRQVVMGARRRGIAVAWIDGPGALVAADWCEPAGPPGLDGAGPAGGDHAGSPWAPLWVVRPPVAADAALCAELLLRTHSFGLVVLDGGPALDAALGVRLQRLARQASAALVRVRGPSEAGGRLVGGRLSFEAQAPAPPADSYLARLPLAWRVAVMRARGGEPVAAEVVLHEPVPDRLTAYGVQPDRPSTRTRAGTRYGR